MKERICLSIGIKFIISTATFLLCSFISVCAAPKYSESTGDIPPCSDTTIRFYTPHLPDSTKDDPTGEGTANVRVLFLGDLCLSCAKVIPYDTVVRRVLLQYLKTDKFPSVRAEAAADFSTLIGSKDYHNDTEMIKALTIAMRNDVPVVRLEAAYSLLKVCHQDTSEVLDTLISLALNSSPETNNPCPRCPISSSSKVRRGAIKGLTAQEFRGDERVLTALVKLSSDSDKIVSKEASNALKRIQKRDQKGGL